MPKVLVMLPDALLAEIDAAAGPRQRTAWIIEACRGRLDDGAKQTSRAGTSRPRSGRQTGEAVPDVPADPEGKGLRKRAVGAGDGSTDGVACPHPREERQQLGYMTRCGRCGIKLS